MDNNTIETPTFATFDIKRLIFRILANWYWFVLTISLAYTYVAVKNMYLVPTYGVHTKIMVKKKQTGEEDYLRGLQFFQQNKTMDAEIEILKSYELNKQVIENLKSFHTSYFRLERFHKSELYLNSPIRFIPNTTAYTAKHVDFKVIILNENEIRIDDWNGNTIAEKVLFGTTVTSGNFNGTVIKTEKFSSSLINKQYSQLQITLEA